MVKLLGRTGIIGETSSWVPTDIGGCVLWLRSDLAWQDAAKTVPCTDESLIYTGEDKSLDNDVVQATEAKRPIYKTNQFNGHPAWRFDGIDDYLYKVFAWNRPEVIYIVLKPITYTNGDTIFDGNSANQGRLFQALPASRYVLYAGQANYLDGYVEIANGIPAIIRSRLTAADGIGIRLNNGTEQITGNASVNISGFTLGSIGDGAGGFANMDFAEAFGYNAVPSSPEDASAMVYLNSRYTIY